MQFENTAQEVAKSRKPRYDCSMLKICLSCKRTWSGGRDCPQCGEGQPLLDVADRAVRRAALRDTELRGVIRTYYGARSAMLIGFFGILSGMVFAVALVRKGFLTAGPARYAWYALAALAPVVPFFALLIGNQVVRRFSRHCIGRPLGLGDIKFAPEPRSEFLDPSISR